MSDVRQRSFFKNEAVTGDRPWYVYVETQVPRGSMTAYVGRFAEALNACAVTDALNDAFRAEGRLLIHDQEVTRDAQAR